MANAEDIHGVAFKNGSITLLARVVGGDGQNIAQADVSAAEYTVHLLDDDDADSRTVVTGHANVALTPADVIFNSLQTDTLWTADTTGYNFRYVLDISQDQAFAVAGRRYLVEVELTPPSGQLVLIRFRVNVI
jgi:hypothetical protein